MALIPPTFFDAVTAIGVRNADGTPQFVATGFLFGRYIGLNQADKDRSDYRIFSSRTATSLLD